MLPGLIGIQANKIIMKYKITFINQIKQLLGVILGIPIAGVIIYVFYQAVGDFSACTTIGLIYFSITFFIAIFIHCEYYVLNKGKLVFIDTDKKIISFEENEPISFKNIEKITISMTQLWYNSGNIWVLPSDSYHYAIIKYDDGKEFIFTSLMASDVECVMKLISGVPLERKLRPIPSPMLSKLFGW
jgi:hypothetical protein